MLVHFKLQSFCKLKDQAFLNVVPFKTNNVIQNKNYAKESTVIVDFAYGCNHCMRIGSIVTCKSVP